MSTENNQANGEAQIRKLRDELTNALRAKDVDGVMSHYAAETVMFVLAPPLQYVTGVNAPGRKGVEEWFASFQGLIGYEIRDLKIAAGETIAFCHSLNHISGMKSDGENVDMWLRETLCFHKIDGSWKITHQHQSVPFYMDSRKAALDLKP